MELRLFTEFKKKRAEPAEGDSFLKNFQWQLFNTPATFLRQWFESSKIDSWRSRETGTWRHRPESGKPISYPNTTYKEKQRIKIISTYYEEKSGRTERMTFLRAGFWLANEMGLLT